MRLIITTCLATLIALPCMAQTTKEEMKADIRKTAGVYYAYPEPETAYTKIPKGYTPFYISHFGRHGSRYLLSDADYTAPMRTLERANEHGALSALGSDLLGRLRSIYAEAEGRNEDLSPLGVRQHRGIAERMYEAFPQVFTGSAKIEARSSIVLRCAMSMAAFGDRLKELNPKLQISYESSQKYMPYLTGRTPECNEFCGSGGAWRAAYDKFYDANTRPDRLMSSLFADKDYLRQYVNGKKLMWQLYWVASDLQNMETEISLYDIFTADELFDLWQTFNYSFYAKCANHADSKGVVKDSFKPLLRNIIESADAAIADGSPAATLRFAHDSNITPLAALMELETFGVSLNEAESLYRYWSDFKVSPMAANLQFVFFNKKGGTRDDILVKVMLNEKEVHLPIATDSFPYYRWSDFRAHYAAVAGM